MGLNEPNVSRNYMITLTAVIHLRFTVTVIFDNFKRKIINSIGHCRHGHLIIDIAEKGWWRNSFSLTTERDLNVTNFAPNSEYTNQGPDRASVQGTGADWPFHISMLRTDAKYSCFQSFWEFK